MSSKHTPGPWHWFEREDDHVYLATPDRGHLYVMDFARKGMRGATPRFSLWNGDDRGRQGGVMHDFLEAGGTLHPDARLIAAAPESHEANRLFVQAINEMQGITAEHSDEYIYDDMPSSKLALAYFAARAAIAKATGEGA